MVNQKAISFKIDIANLEGIDEWVSESLCWTNRNKELNRAVSMYLEYNKARLVYNYDGDTSKMRAFCDKYIHREVGTLKF